MGKLFMPNLTKNIVDIKGNDLQACTVLMQGWRRKMEDVSFYGCHPNKQNHQIFGIIDGHRGILAAKYVSQHMPELIFNHSKYKNGQYQIIINQVFLQLDKKLLQHIECNSSQKYETDYCSGCAVTIILIADKDVYIANCGDCKAIGITNDQECIEFTILHQPQLLEEKQRIEKAGGQVNENRVNGLNLSRTIGDFDFKNNSKRGIHQQLVIPIPSICHYSISNFKYMMMGSDGFWQKLSNHKVHEYLETVHIKQDNTLNKFLTELIDTLPPTSYFSTELGQDNISATLIQFSKDLETDQQQPITDKNTENPELDQI